MGRKTPIAIAAVAILLLTFWGAGVFYWLRMTAGSKVVVFAPTSTPGAAASNGPLAAAVPTDSSHATSAQNQALQIDMPRSADPGQDPSFLALQLRSGGPVAQEDAVGHIRALVITDPRAAALGLGDLVAPLLDAKQYPLIEQVASSSITERPFDPDNVQIAQRALVAALIGEGKYKEALKAAKGYYNVVALASTTDAIDLIAQILNLSNSPELAARFRSEQLAVTETEKQPGPTTQSASALDSPPTQDADIGQNQDIFKSVSVDGSLYDSALDKLQSSAGSRGFSCSNLIGQGNLMLLSDRAPEARQCFEDACRAAVKPKDLRQAVEGIARAIRAEDGNVARANAFIVSLRENPSASGATLITSPASTLDDLSLAAQKTMLAEIRLNRAPPLELERVQSEPSSSAGHVNVEYGFDCSVPMVVHQISPTRFHLSVGSTQFRDWFLFRVEGAAGKTIRFDITTEDQQMAKWSSLNPVYSYTKTLDNYDEHGTADQEVPVKSEVAWNGPVIPQISDGNWYYCSNAWMDTRSIGWLVGP
jgi:hypothetical protein